LSSSTVKQGYSRRYYIYTVLAGTASFLILLWLSFGVETVSAFDWPSLVVFASLAFVSKFLSFRLMGVVTVSMDTAVYVAALLSLGTLPGAWTVFLSMYLKVVWDTLRREVIVGTERRPFLENLTAPLFQGGTGALVAVVAAHILPVKDFVSGDFDRDMHVLWVAPLLAAIFVVIQYNVVLYKYYLRGYAWDNLMRQVFLPGLVAELSVVPLAMVMTVVYHGRGHLSIVFGFLVATYIIMNVVFKRLSDASARLKEKVDHLESLNELGRTICSSLQADSLVPALATQTLQVMNTADAVLVRVWNEDVEQFEDHFEVRRNRSIDDAARESARRLADFAGYAQESFSAAPLAPGQEGTHLQQVDGISLSGQSWLGTPVRDDNQVIGVLVAFAQRPGQFQDSDFGLLQMIGSQAAVALQNSRLYVMASIDGLTRLFVRRYFDRRLSEEVERTRRYGTSFSLLLLDFDDFKEINDTHGHAVGDLVLRKVADIVLAEVRAIDIPSRYGGDEFSVVLPEVNWRGALTLANRILYRTQRETVRAGEELVSFSISIGMASFPDHVNTDGAALLKAADRAMYQAKREGKGMIKVYGEQTGTVEALSPDPNRSPK